MCKKLLITGLILLGAVLLLRKTELGSLAGVWWKDACVSADRSVTPELRLRQLEQATAGIEARIKAEISKLADQTATFEEQDLKRADALRAAQAKRKDAIAALVRPTEAGTQIVSTGSQVAAQLDDLTAEFDRKQAELRGLEDVLASKRELLNVRKQRISQMVQQKQELENTAAQLATRLEKARMQQAEDRTVVSNGQLDRAKELITKVERDLKVMETENDLLKEFGFRNPKQTTKTSRSSEDVLKAAQRILDEK